MSIGILPISRISAKIAQKNPDSAGGIGILETLLTFAELRSATSGFETVLGDLSPKTLDFTGFLEVVPIGCPVI